MFTLRLFCDVASQRSFSAAAQRHGISQSAASQRIGQLEKQLGVTLIDRSVRPLSLTPAGELLLREGRDLVGRYDTLTERVMRMNGGAGGDGGGREDLRGEVVVDAIYSAGIDLLNHLKDSFERQTPRVSVTIDYKRPEQVHEAVATQRCDLGIVSYPGRWRDVEVIPLRDERMSVVCSPRHELAGRQRVHARELGAFSMVNFESDLPVGRRIKRYLRDHGADPHVTNVFDNIDTIKSAVAVTDQIAILPTRTVKREVTAGTLSSIELEPPLNRPIGIILPRRSRRNGRHDAAAPAVQAFIDYLLEHAGPEGDEVHTLSVVPGNGRSKETASRESA